MKSLTEEYNGNSKKFPNTATKQDLKEAHKVKMMKKKILADRMDRGIKPHILANLSKNHPHYGDTPLEHESRKRQNNS